MKLIIFFLLTHVSSQLSNLNQKSSLVDTFNENIKEYTNERAEHIFATVDSSFKYRLNSHRLLAASAEEVYLELVTESRKPIPKTSWVKLAWLTHEIYGFPLKRVEGVSTYFVNVTQGKLRRIQEVRLYVSANRKVFEKDYFHRVHLCTDLSEVRYSQDLDTRYQLAEALSKYFMNLEADEISLSDFKYGCFYFAFVRLEEIKCSHDKINAIKDKLYRNGKISEEFRKALGIINIKSVNFTLSKKCKKFGKKKIKKTLQWIKNAAPILILVGIVVIPILISCYVCRFVRKKQNERRQRQEKKYKEEASRITEQIEEYKRACGLDEEFDLDSETLAPPKWNQNIKRDGKKNTFTQFFHQYVPKSWHAKPISTTITKTRRKSLNPVSRLLDIQKDPIKVKQITTPTSSNRNSARKIAQVPFVTRLVSNPMAPFISGREIRRSKSVSFFDVTDGGNRTSKFENEDSLYRRIHREFNRVSDSTKSCTELDKINNIDHNNHLFEKKTNPALVDSKVNIVEPLFFSSENQISSYPTSKRQRIMESLKSFANNKKETISNAFKEKRRLRENPNRILLDHKDSLNRRPSNDSYYPKRKLTSSMHHINDALKTKDELSESDINEDSYFPMHSFDLPRHSGVPMGMRNQLYSSPQYSQSQNYTHDDASTSIFTSVSEQQYCGNVRRHSENRNVVPSSHKHPSPVPSKSPTVYSWSPGNDLSDYRNRSYFSSKLSEKRMLQSHEAGLAKSEKPRDFLTVYGKMKTNQKQKLKRSLNTFDTSLHHNLLSSYENKSEFLRQHHNFKRSIEDVYNRNPRYYSRQTLQQKDNPEEMQYFCQPQNEYSESVNVRYLPAPDRVPVISQQTQSFCPSETEHSAGANLNTMPYMHVAPNISYRQQQQQQQQIGYTNRRDSASSVVTYMDLGSEYEVPIDKEIRNRRLSSLFKNNLYTFSKALPRDDNHVNYDMKTLLRSKSSPNLLIHQPKSSGVHWENRINDYRL